LLFPVKYTIILATVKKPFQERRISMAATVVTKDTLIGDLLKIDANVAPILMGIGMHCLGCPASQGESIEEAAYVHGIDPNALVKVINEVIAKDAQ
jgi:hybrid cluster-associated redox disulfide protein